MPMRRLETEASERPLFGTYSGRSHFCVNAPTVEPRETRDLSWLIDGHTARSRQHVGAMTERTSPRQRCQGGVRRERPGLPDGQISNVCASARVQTSAKINFFFSEIKSGVQLTSSRPARGAYRDRHGRWERDAVDERMLKRACAPTKASFRTAKPCGPVPPTLGSSLRDDCRQVTGANKPGAPRRARSSR